MYILYDKEMRCEKERGRVKQRKWETRRKRDYERGRER